MIKNCIIICRVSTDSQVTKNSASLDMQNNICKKFIYNNNLKFKESHQIIGSVYRKNLKMRKLISGLKNTNILFYDISRFCRNVSEGLVLSDMALSNNNSLIFITNNFTYKTSSKREKLKHLLGLAQKESDTISLRVKNSKEYLRNKGLYTGGVVPYGYDILKINDNKKLVYNLYEQNVISFIKYAISPEIKSIILNKHLMKILPKDESNNFIPIYCYDSNGLRCNKISQSLSNREISNLLSEYGILKRDKQWNTCKVRKMVKSIKFNNLKLDNFDFNLKFSNLKLEKNISDTTPNLMSDDNPSLNKNKFIAPQDYKTLSFTVGSDIENSCGTSHNTIKVPSTILKKRNAKAEMKDTPEISSSNSNIIAGDNNESLKKYILNMPQTDGQYNFTVGGNSFKRKKITDSTKKYEFNYKEFELFNEFCKFRRALNNK